MTYPLWCFGLLFGVMIACLFLGIPVALALGGIATVAIIIIWGFDGTYVLANSAFSTFSTDTYLAIAMFLLMGNILQRSGIADDLYEMLYPSGRDTEESEALASGFSYTLSGDPKGGNALKIRSACEGKSGTLLCWRDSFGISLYPYLAESYGNALFLRSSDYDLAEIEKTGSDTVLIELVERNLEQLAAAGRQMTGK